jgi:hypothetical protein
MNQCPPGVEMPQRAIALVMEYEMPEYEIKVNQYGERYYASRLIVCQACGVNTYLSGMTIKYHAEHNLPLENLCTTCALKKYVEDHRPKY